MKYRTQANLEFLFICSALRYYDFNTLIKYIFRLEKLQLFILYINAIVDVKTQEVLKSTRTFFKHDHWSRISQLSTTSQSNSQQSTFSLARVKQKKP